MTVRVLVVDDSALMRHALSEILNASMDLQVVGCAANAEEAREALRRLRPDVLTLDVEMPGMNGIEFLDQVMRFSPLPVVMISNMTAAGSETTFRALELGAVDFISKPKGGSGLATRMYAEEVRDKVRAAFVSRAHRKAGAALDYPGGSSIRNPMARERMVFIGASTGGTEALRAVLTRLPEDCAPVLMVQHMPETFTGAFARRLDSLCRIRVKEAEHGEPVHPGVAYLAPGHSHLLVKRIGSAHHCELSQGEPVNRHRPAVDVLFGSAARLLGSRAVGVLLTGMGKDGAAGMLEMRRAGAHNIVQDRESSVVWGMPREAAVNGAAHEIVALPDIAGRIIACLNSENRALA